METRSDAKLSGLGSVGVVGTEHMGIQAGNEVLMRITKEATDSLTDLLNLTEGRRAAVALACAVLNSQLPQSSYVMSVDEKGYVTHSYQANKDILSVLVACIRD